MLAKFDKFYLKVKKKSIYFLCKIVLHYHLIKILLFDKFIDFNNLTEN